MVVTFEARTGHTPRGISSSRSSPLGTFPRGRLVGFLPSARTPDPNDRNDKTKHLNCDTFYDNKIEARKYD